MTKLTFDQKEKIVEEMIGIPFKYLIAVGTKIKFDTHQAQVDGLSGDQLHFKLAEKPEKNQE